jgi:hypothetical protein
MMPVVVIAVVVIVVVTALPAALVPGVSIAVVVPMTCFPALISSFGLPASLDRHVPSVSPFVRRRDPDKARTRWRWLDDDHRNRRRWGVDHELRCGRIRRTVEPLTSQPGVPIALPLPATGVPGPPFLGGLEMPARPEVASVPQFIVSLHPNESPASLDPLDRGRGWWRRCSPPATGRWGCAPTPGPLGEQVRASPGGSGSRDVRARGHKNSQHWNSSRDGHQHWGTC